MKPFFILESIGGFSGGHERDYSAHHHSGAEEHEQNQGSGTHVEDTVIARDLTGAGAGYLRERNPGPFLASVSSAFVQRQGFDDSDV